MAGERKKKTLPLYRRPARSRAERPQVSCIENRFIPLTISPGMSSERPPKVFISYSHDSDEHMERVLSLADRLRADGVDAMIDQYVHDPEDGWQVWTESQMRDADLVLVVCTETYLKRAERREEPGTGHGAIWEISVGYVLLYNQGMKNKKLIPVVFDKADLVYIPLPLQSYTNYCIADDHGYLELYRRLTNQPFITMPELGKLESLPRRERATEKFTRSKPTGLWNVPHQRNEAFTGREQLLTNLRADLLKKGKQALFGLGGVGKTQIAIEYAYRHQDEYTAVLWCFAGTEQSVRGGYAAIAALLDLPEKDSQEQAKVTDAVKRWLEQNTGWLLVLDNADDPAMLKPFLPHQGKSHILLTSRAYTFDLIGILSAHEVNVLSPGEAREFLLRRTSKDPLAKSPEADALAQELGYLPLALEQAGAYIKETGAGFKTYLDGFKKQGLRLLEKKGPVLGNEREQQKRTVATAWALNFADIENNSPASADLLRLSAFMAPDSIPLELLERGGQQLTEPLAKRLAEAAEDSLVLDELLKPLLRYSLIRRNEEKRTYSIHPLVQEVVRDGLSKEEQKAWAERAVRVVNAIFPDPMKFANWPACDRLLPHALACAGFINSWGLEFAEAAHLLTITGDYLMGRAGYAQADPIYRWALSINEKSMGREHPDTSLSLNNLAELYRVQGRFAEAEPLQRRALAIRENNLGPEHPVTAESLNNLGLLLKIQGRYKEAEPLYQRALAIREQAPDCKLPDTAESLNNLAELYRAQGRHKEAEPLYRRALAIDEKSLGADDPGTAIDLNNLGRFYDDQGRNREAEPLHRRALAIFEKALGPEHPDTAMSLNNLALSFQAQGKYKEVDQMYRRSLAIVEKALGPEHPNTILVRNNLIRFYLSQGRNAEADALEKRVKQNAE